MFKDVYIPVNRDVPGAPPIAPKGIMPNSSDDLISILIFKVFESDLVRLRIAPI